MTDSLTVIVPVFNRGRFIEGTLRSILSQAPELPILVIDNCSTDDTVDVVIELRAKHKNITLIQNSFNFGRIENFNEGLLRCNTEWASFLIAGDKYLPNWLETISDAIKSISKDSLEEINLINAYSHNCKEFPGRNLIVSGNTFTHKMLSGQTTFLGPNNNIVRVSAAKRSGGFPIGLKYCFDWALFSVICRNSNILLINKDLMHQDFAIPRVHTSGIAARACEPDILKPMLGHYFESSWTNMLAYRMVSTIRFYGVVLKNIRATFESKDSRRLIVSHFLRYHLIALIPAAFFLALQKIKKNR